MTDNGIRVSSEAVHEDRFSRFRLIPWWDQHRLGACRVLVIGAGALGNEILKNLALLGFRNIVVVDLDRIEESNLSRSVLFRATDIGLSKSEAAAKGVRELAPDAVVQPFNGNIAQDIGFGLFFWADVILAGLDNREARLWINRAAWKANRPWIDGAIEGINGVARVFLPGTPPCYECTLGETDWMLLERRMSCNLLVREPQPEGKVPTTPTVSSIIAGIQVQEAVKLLHELPALGGRGYVFEGLNHTSYVVEYTENPDCMSHYVAEKVTELPECSADLTLDDLLQRARHDLAAEDALVEFSRDIVHRLECPNCGAVEDVLAPVGSISLDRGKCPRDGTVRRVITVHNYSGGSELGKRTLDRLGLPLFDLFTARSSASEIHYLMAGDRRTVLGPLADCVGAENVKA